MIPAPLVPDMLNALLIVNQGEQEWDFLNVHRKVPGYQVLVSGDGATNGHPSP